VTAKPQDGIQIRFVKSESNVSPDSGTTETASTWRIDTTETLQVLYRPIQLRADGSFEGAFLNETTRVSGCDCPADLTVRWRVEAGKLLVWDELTGPGGGGSTRSTPHSIPIEWGTTLQFQNRRKPFILDNRHYVSLWECRFVRDGKTLQTIAFIAAAAPKTDTEFKSALDLYSNGNSKNLPVIRLPEETEQPVPPKTDASPSSSSVASSLAAPAGSAPALSQDAPTSPALEAALEGIQARMRLIRSKKMRFEYTRTTKKNERMPSDYTEKCVLFTHGGNYLEEAQLENGEKKYRYYFGVPDPDNPLYPNKLHQHEGARFDLEGPESSRVFSSHFSNSEMNGIDCTLVPQWAAPSMGYWPSSRKAGSTHNDPEHPGATFFEVEASSNGADRYSSQLGWARVGDKWPQCSEFTQIEGIYWPRRIVWGDETLLISKIETDFTLDPTRLESPHLEAGWTVKISYPLWKANPGGSIRDAEEAFEGKEILWGKPLSPQEIRILTVAQSRWPGAGAYEYNRGRYPLPYYDKERDVIVWAKYDTNLKQHLKVFEGDQLPESYGPLPWENMAIIVQDWIEQFTPDTPEKTAEAGVPTPGGVIETRGTHFPAEYLDQVVAALQKNFVLPPYIRENKTCTVRFKILQDGRLVEPQVIAGQGTGIAGLDQLALNAVLQAGPVPPYPPEYSTRPFVYARVNFAFTPSAP
ncbi:MAG TPA: energy transducer TonB, partial [Candidatus Sumerlaeota bacterium]|nr:energy transducer TonB [Candidatus Sumerlaeota bacterium]